MTCGLSFLLLLSLAADGESRFESVEEWGGNEDRLSVEEYYRYRDLLLNKRLLNDAAASEAKLNRQVIEKAARWYVYRLTWPQYLNGEQGQSLDEVVREACAQIPRASDRSEHARAFLTELGGQMLKRLDEISAGQPVIVRLNAARILACLANAGLEPAADAILRIIENRMESDAVKLYAFRGLKSMFEVHAVNRSVFRDSARELRCIKAAITYIEQARELPNHVAELDGIRYVRREAIRALAKMSHTVLVNGQPRCLSAETLLRVLNGKLTPAPGLSERIEAAIGLATIDPRLHAGYQAEFIAHRLGRFIVELSGLHNNPQGLQGSDAAISWKLSAARLINALHTLQDQAGERPDGPKVAALVRQCDGILRMLVEHSTGADDRSLADFDRWLSENPPATKTLFVRSQGAVVRP